MTILLKSLLNRTSNLNHQLIKTFYSSPTVHKYTLNKQTKNVFRMKWNINNKWKEDNNLPRNPNSFGPLTNLPDYSFKDGRPVPYGASQKKRIDKQREYLVKIKKLVGEVDYAVERHKRLLEEEEQRKQQILDSKLKEKGQKLLIASSK